MTTTNTGSTSSSVINHSDQSVLDAFTNAVKAGKAEIVTPPAQFSA